MPSRSLQDDAKAFLRQIQQRYFKRYGNGEFFKFDELRSLLPCCQAPEGKCDGVVIYGEKFSEHATSVSCPCASMSKKCRPFFASGFLDLPYLPESAERLKWLAWNKRESGEKSHVGARELLLHVAKFKSSEIDEFIAPLDGDREKSWRFFQKFFVLQEQIFEHSFYLNWQQAKKFSELKFLILEKQVLILNMGEQKLRLKAGANLDLSLFEAIVKELDLNSIGLIVFSTQPLQVNLDELLLPTNRMPSSMGVLQLLSQGMQDRLLGILAAGQEFLEMNVHE